MSSRMAAYFGSGAKKNRIELFASYVHRILFSSCVATDHDFLEDRHRMVDRDLKSFRVWHSVIRFTVSAGNLHLSSTHRNRHIHFSMVERWCV